MANWLHSDVLDNGLNFIKQHCDSMLLLKNYSSGDSYETVISNSVAGVALSISDFTISDHVNSSRMIASASKQAIAINNTVNGDDLHIAFVNTLGSIVLWVSNETTNRVIYVDDPINFPQISLVNVQPISGL